MPNITINGGNRLVGDVELHGAKNAILPILAASLLFDDETIILDNVPKILDVVSMEEVLSIIGVEVSIEGEVCTLHTPKHQDLASNPPESFVSKMRATILLLSGLLSATGRAEIALPGGCSIGYRPIDLHISALKSMGATIELEHGILVAEAPKGLQPATIHFDTPSVGATENVIIAATLTAGETVIENASKEPEVLDLIRFLNQSGAKISGAGTSTIRIEGVAKLHGTRYEVITDRMEAATYMVAAAVTAGDITIHHAIPSHMESFITKLQEIGVEVQIQDDQIRVIGKKEYHPENPVDIRAVAFPGFQSDMQVLVLPLLLQVHTNSMIVDNVFDQRFRHVDEFKKVGAQITQLDNMLIINQNQDLFEGKVEATDVRAAAALVLLGLSNKMHLTISSLRHLARGYEGLIENLQALGADITVLDFNGFENYSW